MKTRNIILGTILAGSIASLAAIGTVTAFPRGGCGHGGMPHPAALFGGPMGHHASRLMRLADKLDLSAEQREKVWDVLDAKRTQFRDNLFTLMDGRKQLRTAAHADRFDENAVRALADEQSKAIANMMVLRAKTMHEIRGLLNPEQRKQLDDIRNRRGGRGGFFEQKMTEFPSQ